jgi:hemoglobin
MNESAILTQPSIAASLYDKLGGAKGIASLVDDIVAAHLENPVIRARFLPYLDDMDRVQVIKRHFCEFLGMGCGGPEVYSGRDMITTHKGMNISNAEFVAALDDILLVLDRHQVDEQTKKEMLYMAYSLKSQVINV